jgi:hypothetical protein
VTAKRSVVRHWIGITRDYTKGRAVTACGITTGVHTHCAVTPDQVTCKSCLRVPKEYGGPPARSLENG